MYDSQNVKTYEVTYQKAKHAADFLIFFILRTAYKEIILQNLNFLSASSTRNYSYILFSADAKDKIET